MRFVRSFVIVFFAVVVGCGRRSSTLLDGAQDSTVADVGSDASSNDAGADDADAGCFPGELTVSLYATENLCTQAAMGETGVKVLFISFEASPIEAVDLQYVTITPRVQSGFHDVFRNVTIVNEVGNPVVSSVAGPVADGEFIRFLFPQDGSVDVTVPAGRRRQFVVMADMNTAANGVESGTRLQMNLLTFLFSGAVGAIGQRSVRCNPELPSGNIHFAGEAVDGEFPGPIITVYRARPWTEFAPDTPRGDVGPGHPGQVDAHLIVHNVGDVDLMYDAPYGLIRLMSDFSVSSALACAYWDSVSPENLSDCARHEGRLGNIAEGLGGISTGVVLAGGARHVYFTVDTHEAPPGGSLTLFVSGPGVWSDGVTMFIPEHCWIPTEHVTLTF